MRDAAIAAISGEGAPNIVFTEGGKHYITGVLSINLAHGYLEVRETMEGPVLFSSQIPLNFDANRDCLNIENLLFAFNVVAE